MANKIEYAPLRDFYSIKQLMQEAVAATPDKVAFQYKENGEIKEVTTDDWCNITGQDGTDAFPKSQHVQANVLGIVPVHKQSCNQ